MRSQLLQIQMGTQASGVCEEQLVLGLQLCMRSRWLLNVPVLRSADQSVNGTDSNS